MKQHHPVFHDNCTNNFIYWVSWYQILWVWKEKNGNGYWLYWKALRFTGFPLHIYIRFGSSPQSHLTWNNVFRIYIYPIFTSGLRLQSSYLQWWLLCIMRSFPFHKTNQKATTSIRIFMELLQYHFLPFNGPNNPTNTMLSKCLTKHAQNFLSMVIQKANYVSWKAEKWKKMKFSVQGTSI